MDCFFLDHNMNRIYSNRAACHLLLKQYRECIQDCTCVSLLPTLPYFHPFAQSMLTALEIENNFIKLVNFQAAVMLKLYSTTDVLLFNENFQAYVLRKNAGLTPSHFYSLPTKPCTKSRSKSEKQQQKC